MGGPDDLERLGAIREETAVPLRVDANEGWTLEQARDLVPALVELGVELIEQPFPAEDLESFRALREVEPRPPIVVDEGCHDLRDVARVAGYADAINVKLAKAGGVARGGANGARGSRPRTFGDDRVHGRVTAGRGSGRAHRLARATGWTWTATSCSPSSRSPGWS